MADRREGGAPNYLYPRPTPEGVAGTRALYRRRGIEVTDEEAEDMLGRVMRFLYLTAVLENEARARGKGGGGQDA